VQATSNWQNQDAQGLYCDQNISFKHIFKQHDDRMPRLFSAGQQRIFDDQQHGALQMTTHPNNKAATADYNRDRKWPTFCGHDCSWLRLSAVLLLHPQLLLLLLLPTLLQQGGTTCCSSDS
jgi:hypothetical protein